jgi:pyruvate formate lyase activating enzyme
MEEFSPALCHLCGKESILVSAFLGVCGECIQNDFPRALPFLKTAHRIARKYLGMPPAPPGGKPICTLCGNRCGKGGKSFCGLIEEGRRLAGTARKGLLEWYYDPLPSNCVASFVCPEKRPGRENLAVFYGGCNFSCLFCQNWHHHSLLEQKIPLTSVEDLEKAVHGKVACLCFFGGDPIPQIPHALALARRLKDRLRICWETNGAAHPRILKEMFQLSLESGGILKFDLKAFDERLHFALTGVSNRLTLRNFSWAAKKARDYPQVTVVASTLLVPGYITPEEVEKIAAFIASQNPEIPYALLGFAPNFFLTDLPPTSTSHAEEALRRAQKQGLKNLHLGNPFLLSRAY